MGEKAFMHHGIVVSQNLLRPVHCLQEHVCLSHKLMAPSLQHQQPFQRLKELVLAKEVK